MKILIAEDDPVSSRVLEKNLQSWGHDVVVATTGRDAWERFQLDSFPIVISDWMMPEMDGLELVRHIRAHDGAQYVYVILLTAKAQTEDVVRGIEGGADDYLTKPLHRDELRARVQAGERIIELERRLAERNAELTAANERMREDLEAAARIQQSLLPTLLPEFPGVDFVWRFVPCDELAGDILNVFALPEGGVGFYLLDVSGHGVQAALLSVTLSRVLVASPEQSSLLARSVDGVLRIVPPAEVARRLNARFAAGQQHGQFFTLVYGVLDPGSRRLRYISAGHPGPVLLTAGEAPRVLEATGPPLGIMDGLTFEEHVLELSPGDRLFVYSDGITEARAPDGELYGSDRLVSFLDEQRGTPLADTLPRLLEGLSAWRGGPGFEDDVSSLAFEITSDG